MATIYQTLLQSLTIYKHIKMNSRYSVNSFHAFIVVRKIFATFSFRDNGADFLKKVLSIQDRNIRRRRVNVNIQVTFLSWVIEFFTGAILLVVYFSEQHFIHWYELLDGILISIILPSTYIINREVTKDIIIVRNWLAGIRSIFR